MNTKDTHFSEQAVANRIFDSIAGTVRVSLFPATSKRLIDNTTTANVTYVGVAAPGTATNAVTGWLIEKIDQTASIISITHATDSWDNRVTTTYT